MPKKDAYHDIVREALVKDGWQITDDPFLIGFRGTLLFADLGAEKKRLTANTTHALALKSKCSRNQPVLPNSSALSGNMSYIAA